MKAHSHLCNVDVICRWHYYTSENAFQVSFWNLNYIRNRDDIEILKVLISHAESVTASNDGDGECGADAIFNAGNEDWRSPVDYLGQLQEFLFETKKAGVMELLLQMKVKGLKWELDNGWTVLHHCAKEGIVTPTILRALEHQVNALVHQVNSTNILIERCEGENQDQVKMLLEIPGIIDHEMHDGLTGFVISLIKQNKDIIMAFLQSDVGSHNKNVFLASEFCRLPSVENKDLQISIRQFLSSQQTEMDASRDTIDKEKDERFVFKMQCRKYLRMNTFSIPV